MRSKNTAHYSTIVDFVNKYSIVSRARKDDAESSNTEHVYIFKKESSIE